jgi:biopolymer transport protein ExbB
MLTEKLLRLVIVGGSEWVMVLLIVLSVLSVGVMIERALYYRRYRLRLDRLDRSLLEPIGQQDTDKIRQIIDREDEPTLRAAVNGLERPDPDRDAVERLVHSALERERLDLERRLSFLGTLGNNAPFIGLFGTVLGIIRAFQDLALAQGRPDPSVVMGGISEALVATAIGLFVALPAVLFYNYFQRNVDRTLSITEALAQGILAAVPAAGRSAPREQD